MGTESPTVRPTLGDPHHSRVPALEPICDERNPPAQVFKRPTSRPLPRLWTNERFPGRSARHRANLSVRLADPDGQVDFTRCKKTVPV